MADLNIVVVMPAYKSDAQILDVLKRMPELITKIIIRVST